MQTFQFEKLFGELRLNGMSEQWRVFAEMRSYTELSLTEGVELLLQSELLHRRNNRYERLRKLAQFRYAASVEELAFDAKRGLDKLQINQLLTGSYIAKGESILITGATGCGKSFVATALGHHACSQGRSVAYFNTHKLLIKTKMARIDGSIYKLFEQLAKTDLLILDDFGLTHLEPQQQIDLMEIVEDRHSRKSTLIISQLPVSSWYQIIGEATIADAILDRLVHTSHRIELRGESLRKKL